MVSGNLCFDQEFWLTSALLLLNMAVTSTGGYSEMACSQMIPILWDLLGLT